MRSPNRAFSTPHTAQKAVTIFDQIVEWFHGEIRNRKRVASVACAYLAVVSFVLIVSVLKLSIWAPVSSVKGNRKIVRIGQKIFFADSLTWWLFPSEWVPIIIIGVASTLHASFIIFQLCKVDQVPRISASDTIGWVGSVVEFAYRFVFVFTALHVADSSLATGYAWLTLSFAISFSSVLTIFRNDFHLDFISTQIVSTQLLLNNHIHQLEQILPELSEILCRLCQNSSLHVTLRVVRVGRPRCLHRRRRQHCFRRTRLQGIRFLVAAGQHPIPHGSIRDLLHPTVLYEAFHENC